MDGTLPPGTPRLLNVAQTCAALGIGASKLYELLAGGQITGRKLGDRLLFRPDDIAKYIATLPVATVRPLRKRKRR
jgi:excisionase family DNA binding protein